jgi:anaerobic ribonucleoside-triphosphate reductase activating protein
MNIAHIEEHSFIYGPNCRFVIWVQGCSIRCKGCWNTDMWSFEKKTTLLVQELLRKIENEKEFIEGVTILGGEPLDQYEEVAELLSACREIGLSTMLFTGYEMTEIVEKQMTSILDNLDILITGRYDKTKRTLNHQWIGSTNQEIHFLTDKHNKSNINNGNYVEITLNENGSTNILGFPEKAILNSIY